MISGKVHKGEMSRVESKKLFRREILKLSSNHGILMRKMYFLDGNLSRNAGKADIQQSIVIHALLSKGEGGD